MAPRRSPRRARPLQRPAGRDQQPVHALRGPACREVRRDRDVRADRLRGQSRRDAPEGAAALIEIAEDKVVARALSAEASPRAWSSTRSPTSSSRIPTLSAARSKAVPRSRQTTSSRSSPAATRPLACSSTSRAGRRSTSRSSFVGPVAGPAGASSRAR